MNKFHFNEHKQETWKCDWLIGHLISIRYVIAFRFHASTTYWTNLPEQLSSPNWISRTDIIRCESERVTSGRRPSRRARGFMNGSLCLLVSPMLRALSCDSWTKSSVPLPASSSLSTLTISSFTVAPSTSTNNISGRYAPSFNTKDYSPISQSAPFWTPLWRSSDSSSHPLG